VNWHPLLLSFEVALLGTGVALLVGVAVAGAIASWRFPGRELVDVLCTAPLVLPPTVLGYYVLVALGRAGPLGRAWEAAFGAPIVFTPTGAVVAAVLGALPFVVKSSRAAMEEVDPRLVNAARTLGANRLRAFVTVVLPLSVPGILAGATLGFARALGDFGVTLMVAGDIPGLTRTSALAIYDAVQANRDAEAHGLVALLTALAIGALWVVNRLVRRGARVA
jgi:molybdate transport system permease protein